MYFKQIDEIVAGTKTVTRRVCKPNELHMSGLAGGDTVCTSVYTYINGEPERARLKWRTGRDYAVSPGRGKPGVWWIPGTTQWWDDPTMLPDNWRPLRIFITSIRREPLQAITEADAVAEGCDPVVCCECDGEGQALYHRAPAYIGGTALNKYAACQKCDETGVTTTARDVYQNLWERINGAVSWNKNPDVWRLEFEVKQSGTHPPSETE